MKHFTLAALITLSFMSGSLHAQRRGYAYATRSPFQHVLAEITVQKTDHSKLYLARTYFNRNAFTVAELNQVLYQLHFEANKVTLAKEAYFKVSDIQNFHMVYYAIANPVYQRDLRAFVDSQNRWNSNRGVQFPPLNYPNASYYQGPKGTYGYMDDFTFKNLTNNIFNARDDYSRQTLVNQYMAIHAFNVEQFMKVLTIINSLEIRFALAQSHINHVYDLGNRNYLSLVFGETVYKTRFQSLLYQIECDAQRFPQVVSDYDMQQILTTLGNEPFESARLNLAKTIVQSKSAFTTNQISRIMASFNFDSNRLELAKFAYGYTVDRDNYYMLSNSLTFLSNRRALLDFIGQYP